MNAKKESAASAFRWLRAEDGEFDPVLRRLMREASQVVPGLSSDPSLTDPLARLLLSAVAREYTRVYGKLDDVVDMAHRRLVSQLLSFPRAPRPSSTVLRLRVKDPGTRVDDALRVIGRKAVAGPSGPEETNLEFVSLEEHALSGLAGCTVLLEEPSGRVLRIDDGSGELGAERASWTTDDSGYRALHVGLDLDAESLDEEIALFVLGGQSARDAILWSPWTAGPRGERCVPGRQQAVDPWHGGREPELFRSRSDLHAPTSPYEVWFAHLPARLLRAGEGEQPAAAASGVEAGHLPAAPRRVWLRVDLTEAGEDPDYENLRLLPDCVIAHNVHPRTEVVGGGIEPEQSLRLPLPFSEIFQVLEVRDAANAVVFADAETREGLHAEHRYHLDTSPEGNSLLRLSSARPAMRPRQIEIDFFTTFASQADGLDPGSISIIFDRSRTPGVTDATNVVPSTGGAAAGRNPDHAEELRAALATRSRAVTRHDFLALARAFDPRRVKEAAVERGVSRVEGGWTRSVVVRVQCAPDAFRTPHEREAFAASLHDHLQQRTVVGQPVEVRLEEAAE